MSQKPKRLFVSLVSDETLAHVAGIMGGSSAAQLALEDMARRRESGEDPVAVQHGATILVVPRADLTAITPEPRP